MDSKELERELLKLVKLDQKDLGDLGDSLRSLTALEDKLMVIKPTAKRCQERAEQMIRLIRTSSVRPTISNIGEEASSAVILLALHSYVEIMEEINDLLHAIKQHEPKEVPATYLAVLVDRISIIKTKLQKLGTVSYGDNRQEYLVPIQNVNELNQRRRDYELEPLEVGDGSLKQKPMSKQAYLLNFAFMDRKITD